jgi:N-acetylglucosamine-6-sulfatase
MLPRWRSSLAALVLGFTVLLAGAAQAKPNIIVILTDDQEVSLVQQMPNLKSLIISQGATFAQAFYNDPLCCPSRATMLTGRYAQNTKTFSAHGEFVKAGMESRTIAVQLQAGGYRTGLIGKYLNSYPKPKPTGYVPPGWEHWLATSGQGYYNYRMFDEKGRTRIYGSETDEYQTDVLAREAHEFLDSALDSSRPYFLWLSLHAPHVPNIPADLHKSLLPNLKAPQPPSFNETDVSDKPGYIRSRARFSKATLLGLDGEYRERARSLLAVDELIKSIIDRLKADKSLENTYLVFASDNGWVAGPHRMAGGKGVPYEESILMPLYVRGPGIAAGSKLDHLVGNVDLAPTIAEWAGVTLPAPIDGRSLAPLLKAGAPKPESWRQSFPLFFKEGTAGNWPGWRGVRTRRHAYVEYDNGETELYDMAADPYQLTSLHMTAPAKLRASLAELTAKLAACAGDSCRTVEDAAIP